MLIGCRLFGETPGAKTVTHGSSPAMSSFIVIFILLAAAVSLDDVHAQNSCYQCNSETDKGCGDPFDASAFTNKTYRCTADNCNKIITSTSQQTVIARGCAASGLESGCQKASAFGVTVNGCVCTGNLCNTASHDTFGRTFLMAITGPTITAILYQLSRLY